jgi:hypothetical protein
MSCVSNVLLDARKWSVLSCVGAVLEEEARLILVASEHSGSG